MEESLSTLFMLSLLFGGTAFISFGIGCLDVNHPTTMYRRRGITLVTLGLLAIIVFVIICSTVVFS